MSRKQKRALKIFRSALNKDYDIVVKLSNFTSEEIEILTPKKNILATEGGALSLVSLNKDGEVLGATVLMDPSLITDIPLFNEEIVYIDSNGKLISGASSCPPGVKCATSHTAILDKNGQSVKAPKSEAATAMHEIGHPLFEGKGQKKVLKFDNLIRKILKTKQRSSSDPEHN